MNYKEEILKQYPHLLRRDGRFWGLECGEGWHQLIYEFFQEIEPLVKDSADFTVLQIKQKFGTLRIYTNHDVLVQDALHRAEKKAAETCEICGDKASTIEQPWGAIRCGIHAK